MSYYLGIDIGTTKVATVICDDDGRIIDVQSLATKADVNTPSAQSEQDHNKIFSAIDTCITSLSEINRNQIVSIGVTGQMHGVILWGESKVSNLVTWQDKRCDVDGFLSKIAKATGENLSSGFGSATLAWLAKHRQLPGDYQHAATIHDYLVSCMCNLEQPIMDPTNAASWGLFNISDNQWQIDNINKLNIPSKLYPKIVSSGSIAGKLSSLYSEKWGLNSSIPVTAAIGDNQASLLATINEWDKEISLTIGTGAQISVVLPPGIDIKVISTDTCDIRPFVDGRYIAVAAPLCGGSAFAWLIKWFNQWCDALGIKIPENINLYDFFIEEGQKEENTDLCIEPNFLGERHDAELRGKISNITLGNFTPGNVALSLTTGIISNLKSMIPEELLADKDKIIASGNALRQTPLLIKAAEKIFHKPVEIIDSQEEAACGAAKWSQITIS
jgi:sedoheptulokinase